MKQKVAFIDRDGTLISEPPIDFQVDRLDKLKLEPGVITALLALQQAGYQLVIVSNQDGLGTDNFRQQDFDGPQQMMMQIFQSQGIHFQQVLICPHPPEQHCDCRKPNTGLVRQWLQSDSLDKSQSVVIGDRQTDLQLAANMGITGIAYGQQDNDWPAIARRLTQRDRTARVVRTTRETAITVNVWLDRQGGNKINTGIGFFDHMLEQIATHAGIRLQISIKGDLYIDDHHTVEDCALALGSALAQALGDKRGIDRFGFTLPMDECLARCALDISGRPWLEYKAEFKHRQVGDLSTEMIEHFFNSLAYSMACTLHIRTKGHNDHHRAESLFKVFGRTLRQAIRVEGNTLPSSKGVL